jgi:hypothetical protein
LWDCEECVGFVNCCKWQGVVVVGLGEVGSAQLDDCDECCSNKRMWKRRGGRERNGGVLVFN